MCRNPGLIIFDLDGTLIDARKNLKENINYALKVNGYPPFKGTKIYAMIGYPLIDIYKMTLPKNDAHLATKLVRDYRKRYKKTCHVGVKILPGVKQALGILKSMGFKLAIATAKGEAQTKLLLKRLGLYDYFDVISGYNYGKKKMRPKPHPDMLLHIMKRLKVSREHAMIVGDTVLDVKAGRNAGICSVAVKTGVKLGITKPAILRSAKPDAVIESVKELPAYLQKRTS